MKLTKLSLIEETKEFYIFSVSFKSFAGTAFFGEKTKKAFKSKKGSLSYWMDSGDWVIDILPQLKEVRIPDTRLVY